MALKDINSEAIVTPSWDADYVFVSVGGTAGPRKALFTGPANCVFATPAGEAGAPTFRELVPGDMPSDLAGDNETVTIGSVITINPATGEIVCTQGSAFTTEDLNVTGSVVVSGAGTVLVTLASITLSGLPTSASGLTAGRVWRSGNDLKIV
jgi:hypothetical protein